jgi:hypothetical protein
VCAAWCRLAEGVRVRAAEEIRLHVHLLNLELALDDSLMNPLVRRIEAARVADHANESCFLLCLGDSLRVRQTVGERDLDLHVLACAQASDALRGMHLRRRAENHRIDVFARERLVEIRGDVLDAEFGGDAAGLLELATDERNDLDAIDLLQRLEVFDPECARAC